MKALLFGSIGVIVDSSALQLDAYNRAFEEFGLDWHWDEAGYRDMLTMAGGQARLRRYAEQTGKDVPSDETIAAIHERKTALFDEALANGGAPARPGVARLMDAARERSVLLGFITSTEKANVEATLEAAELEPSDFDIVTHRGNVDETKPDSAPYLKALDSLGLEAREALAIEDTEVCLPAALEAGIATVATPNAFAERQDFSAANAVVDHLGDEARAARTLAGPDIVRTGLVTLDSLAELLEGVSAPDGDSAKGGEPARAAADTAEVS